MVRLTHANEIGLIFDAAQNEIGRMDYPSQQELAFFVILLDLDESGDYLKRIFHNLKRLQMYIEIGIICCFVHENNAKIRKVRMIYAIKNFKYKRPEN